MKLLFLRPFSASDTAVLKRGLEADYELVFPPDYGQQTLVNLVDDVDVCVGAVIFAELIERAEKLKLLQILGAGINAVDSDLLSGRGIRLGNSHSNAPYVAEHALALLFTLLKKTHLHDALLRRGVWFRPSGKSEDDYYVSDTIRGKKVGLIGFGQIGQRIARFLSGFDVDFLVYRRGDDVPQVDGVATNRLRATSLTEVLVQSDVVFICLPLTEDTRGLLGSEQINSLKSGAFVINVARGEIIDQKALYEALEHNEIAGAGIDVWWEDAVEVGGVKYPSQHCAFHKLQNVVMSPYRAGYLRYDSPHLNGVLENLQSFARNGDLLNEVNIDRGY
jgi:phosphoglycerate dehydrogenase-like enzyme